MTEIHINDPQPFDDDLVIEKSLRPDQMDEFIGQKDVVNSLKLYIEAANNRNEALDHVLLFGPPGLGKTTLSNIIAKEELKSFNNSRYIKLSRNFGYQANIKAGYDNCKGDAAIQLDADGEDDPKIISEFI